MPCGYQHIWTDKRHGGTLYLHLRQSHKKRKKQYGSKDKRGQIRNRVSIDERPAIVEEKTRIGDWEIDTVIGQNHQGALVTIVDRVSKFTLIKKVDSKHAEVVTEATIILLKPYLDKALTITADNGKEFAGHETIKAHLNADVYFAHPYHSWERGLNENTNGLIRQYFTKGSSFEDITDADVEAVMHKLNHRPRKTLNYKTPHAVFFAEQGQKAAWYLGLHFGVESTKYKIEAVVESYMKAVEEIINVKDLVEAFTEVVKSGSLQEVMDEIVTQSKVEFNYSDDEESDSEDL